jgi:uncharacterized coiled-coil DUF342 family protein
MSYSSEDRRVHQLAYQAGMMNEQYTALKMERDDVKDKLEELLKENEELKEQVSRGEVFRLREKIKQIELSNKQYVLKLKQNMLLFTQEHDQKIKELKKDLEKCTRGRDKWRYVSNEMCEEHDVLLKENERLKEENQEMFAEIEQLKKN